MNRLDDVSAARLDRRMTVYNKNCNNACCVQACDLFASNFIVAISISYYMCCNTLFLVPVSNIPGIKNPYKILSNESGHTMARCGNASWILYDRNNLRLFISTHIRFIHQAEFIYLILVEFNSRK